MHIKFVINNPHRFATLTAQTRAQQVYDPLFVVGKAVGIETLSAYCRVAGLALLVLVEDPLHGGAAAQTVNPCLVRYSGQSSLARPP